MRFHDFLEILDVIDDLWIKIKSKAAIQVDMWTFNCGIAVLKTLALGKCPASAPSPGPQVAPKCANKKTPSCACKVEETPNGMIQYPPSIHGTAWYIYLDFMLDVYGKMWVNIPVPWIPRDRLHSSGFCFLVFFVKNNDKYIQINMSAASFLQF